MTNLSACYRCLIVYLLLLSGCASLPDNNQQVPSYAYTDTGNTRLGQMFSQLKEQHGQGKDAFLLLNNGLDAFVARAALIRRAEKSLDVQYYLYHQDLVGRLFTGLLLRAADRGVRIRILVDDMDMDGRDARLLALDAHPNIEIRLFNPFDRSLARLPQYVTGLGSITRRMHNKSLTADNQVTILGGRNIGNEYFNADPSLDFADLDVLAAGQAARQASSAFDRYWNSELAYPVTTLIKQELTEKDQMVLREQLETFMKEQADSDYMKALHNSELARRFHDKTVAYYYGEAEIVVDDPDKITHSRDDTELHLVSQLEPYFDHLENELIILSPYFVPGKEGVVFFKRLIDKGVRVRILTNSLASSDVGIVHAGYAKYRKDLLRAGVELYEMNRALTREQRKQAKGIEGSSKASLHAKTFILDRKNVFIGSLNLDPRSFYENTEIGIVIKQPELAASMAGNFDRGIEKSSFRLELVDDEGNEEIVWHGYENDQPVTFDVDPYSSFWRRLGIDIMSLLPIESQL